jgi:hypothetical protein
MKPKIMRYLTLLWPSFLGACLIELLVFGWVNPGELHIHTYNVHLTIGWVYTLAFFVFWTGCLLTSILSFTLALASDRLDDAPRSSIR